MLLGVAFGWVRMLAGPLRENDEAGDDKNTVSMRFSACAWVAER